MLRGGTERSHVLPTDGEEHALCTQAKLGNSGIDVRHTHPAVSVGELPWVTPQDEQGQLAPLGGGTSVGGDPRGKRMRGVDDGPNVLGIQPVCQAFGAPEAAYATGNGELRGSRYPPRQGQRRRKALGRRRAVRASSLASVVPPRMRMRMTVSDTSVRAPDNTPMRWLSIIGIGEDGVQGLSPIARQLIEGAELVVGGARHLKLAGSLVRGERLDLADPNRCCLSADPYATRTPGCRAGDRRPISFRHRQAIGSDSHPPTNSSAFHRSAFALAAARMGWALQDVATLHPARPRPGKHHPPPAARGAHPGALLGRSTPQKLAGLLTSRGLGASQLTVFEHMGGPA